MNFLRDIIEFLRTLVDWWFVVQPWEQAVRTRFGRRVTLFGAGIHVKIPYFDTVYVQNVRRRVLTIGVQTTTTRDGQCVTVNGSLGYRIGDVLKLHMTLHDAESSVLQEVSGLIQKYIAANDASQCTPKKIMETVGAALPLSKYGLVDCDFFLSGFVKNVPAVRLISEGLGGFHGGSSLSTGGIGSLAVAPGRY